VVDIGDLGLVARRIGGDVVLQRYRKVDDAPGHALLLDWIRFFDLQGRNRPGSLSSLLFDETAATWSLDPFFVLMSA
jgi:hypothetical protein